MKQLRINFGSLLGLSTIIKMVEVQGNMDFNHVRLIMKEEYIVEVNALPYILDARIVPLK
jgi:hypothetical protein